MQKNKIQEDKSKQPKKKKIIKKLPLILQDSYIERAKKDYF